MIDVTPLGLSELDLECEDLSQPCWTHRAGLAVVGEGLRGLWINAHWRRAGCGADAPAPQV